LSGLITRLASLLTFCHVSPTLNNYNMKHTTEKKLELALLTLKNILIWDEYLEEIFGDKDTMIKDAIDKIEDNN